MNGIARAVAQILRSRRARRAALLLAVLLAGSWVTASSQGWIGSLPTHGHLLLGVAHGKGGTTRHIHPGDELDRAQGALRPVESSPSPVGARPGAAQPDDAGRRVLSLMPASASQPEINTWSFAGALDAAWGHADPGHGSPLPAADERGRESRAVAPPPPPPRNRFPRIAAI